MSDERLSDLGAFLKSQRMKLQPEQVGLPAASSRRRRARGLRREEVAALACISADYYARIEQGRRSAPKQTLDVIARALRLDDAGCEYLLELSANDGTRPRRRQAQKVTVPFQRLLDSLTENPAFILGCCMDVLAWNRLAAALITDFSALPERHRNFVRICFTNPAMRSLYAEWSQDARLCVAQLHMELARDPRDPRLTELVGELSMLDADFRRWWNDHQVAGRSQGTKRFRHPIAGDLTLRWDILACAGDPDQQFVFWSAEPGSPSYERLRALAEKTASA